MNRRYRKTIIAGNWKMNKTPAEAKALIEEMKPLLSKTKWCEMVLCVPFTDIQVAVKAAKGSKIAIGAENMHFEKSGAFTGEISADMLKELGVKYVIIGHSERRQYFNETDEACNKKVLVALENGLRPILCVGESLTEREQDVTMEVIRKQIKIALQGVAVEEYQKRLSSLTSRSGRSAPVRPLPPSRRARSAARSATACARSTARGRPAASPSSTAAR